MVAHINAINYSRSTEKASVPVLPLQKKEIQEINEETKCLKTVSIDMFKFQTYTSI